MSSDRWTVLAPGLPVPKPGPVCYARGTKEDKTGRRRARHVLTLKDSPGYKRWRKKVKAAGEMIAEQSGTIVGPVAVTIHTCFPFPTTMKPEKRLYPITRRSGDIDKVERLILDALTDAGVWHDDSQVVQTHNFQWYLHSPGRPERLDQTGALITIHPLSMEPYPWNESPQTLI